MPDQDTAQPDLKVAIIPVTPFQQNCILLWADGSKSAAIVDPGGDLDRIRAAVDEHGLKVDKLVLTHGHIDHAGGADELAQLLKVPIIGPHRDDKLLLDHLEEQGRLYGLRGVRNCAPGRWLEEGDIVAMAGYDFAVLHCPGHSPGSVVYYQQQLRLALCGDVIFQGSIGRSDLPGGDHDTLIASIRTKLYPLGDDVTFICGHGPASTIGHERATNPFLT